MSCEDELAPPSGTVLAKRPAAKVPVQFDWHNYLIFQRIPGKAYALDEVFRPKRRDATGFQYRCTKTGTASGRSDRDVRLPAQVGAVVPDGSAEFTAEAISAASLRATIVTSNFPAVSGVTLSDVNVADMAYIIYVASGTVDVDYQIRHEVTLSGAPGELEVGIIILPVRN